MSYQETLQRPITPIFYSQAAEEHASRVLETHRVPDPYYFLIDQDGDLFSPSALLKVKRSISTTLRVGVLEAQALGVISKWARDEQAGAIAWLSPPEEGIYPVSKVIISEIERVNGVKRILNRAIVLDIDGEECLDLGQRLSGYSTNRPFLTHLDQLRSTPIIMDTKNKTWIEIMEEVMPSSFLWKSVRRGDEVVAKQEALAQAQAILTKYSQSSGFNDYDRDREMQKMLGDKPESCPPRASSGMGQTAFQVFSSHSMESDSMGSLTFPCPACGAINKRPREGYVERCQNSACHSPEKVRC